MTRTTRAWAGALAAGSLSLGMAGAASAQAAQAINDISGTVSELGFSCLGLLTVVGEPNCAYDAQETPGVPPVSVTGPIAFWGTYEVGQSPWDRTGVPCDDVDDGPECGFQAGNPADVKYATPLVDSTVTIDDNATPADCSDDLLSADIRYGAAVINFIGPTGDQGEERWTVDGDLGFQLLPTTVDFGVGPNDAGGCDYVIGDKGAPVTLVTNSGAEYGDDVNIAAPPGPGDELWTPNNGDDYLGIMGPTITSVWVGDAGPGTNPNNNAGAPMTVTNGASYSCQYYDNNNGAIPCPATQAHHCIDCGGNRATIENSIWVVSTDGSGNITAADVYPVHELAVANLAQPEFNSPRWQFTGVCNNCGDEPTAVDDDGGLTIINGSAVEVDILANDLNLVADENTDTVTVNLGDAGDAQLPGASCVINGSPGLVGDISLTYTPGGTAGNDTCQYNVDYGGPSPTNTATVSITVEEPAAVDDDGGFAIANGAAVEVDILANDLNLVEDENSDTVTVNLVQNAELAGASCVIDGSPGLVGAISLTYTPGTVAGNDTCQYNVVTIFGGATTNTATVSVTVENPLVPVANDATAPEIDTTFEAPENTSSVIDVATIAGNELGNPPSTVNLGPTAPALGTVAINGTSLTYTPNATSFVGTDTYGYVITDADGDASDEGIITVNYVDSQPALENFEARTAEDTPVDVDLLEQGLITPGNGELGDHELGIAMMPTNGQAELNGTVLTYTPNEGFFGTDTVEVFIEDANGDRDVGVVTVTVREIVTLERCCSAVSPLSLLLLPGVPLLRRRRRG